MSQCEGCNLLRIVCPLWIEAEACGKGEWLPCPLPGSFCTGPQIMLPTWIEQMNSMIRLAYRKDHLDCYADCKATGGKKRKTSREARVQGRDNCESNQSGIKEDGKKWSNKNTF